MDINIHSFIYSGESSGEAKFHMPLIYTLAGVVVVLILFNFRKKIWRCFRRQNEPNNERQALNQEIIRNDYAANHENRIAVNGDQIVDV